MLVRCKRSEEDGRVQTGKKRSGTDADMNAVRRHRMYGGGLAS